jgi:aldehyde dehydrogenase (NAD+)
MENLVVVDHYVHGARMAPSGGDYLPSLNPADGSVVAEVAQGGEADVDSAVRSARSAVAGWSRVKPRDREAVLYQISLRLRENLEELAVAETLENGKPISQARGDIEVSARYFEYYAGAVDKTHGETIPLGSDYHSYTRLEPFGVTAHILPWNAPLQQAARGVAPALAAGNVVVAKPAEETSVTCVRLAEIGLECGLPPGALNVITGRGEVVGAALVRHPEVDKIAFTGSVPTGKLIMTAAAERIISVTLELGGKSPNIVFADADLDAAASGAIRGIYFNAGQVCSAGSRLLVHKSVHDDLVQRIVDLQKRVTLGPGLEDPGMGPITTADQWHKVQSYLELAETEGAEFACGGRVPDDAALRGGQFIEPTVAVNVANSMRVAQEEIFGPVLCVIPFDDDDQAVAMANDTPFGLVAGVWTRDASRVHRVAADLQVGQVYVNEYFAGGVETPFGGYKQSGIGREKGIEGLRHYMQVKTITVRL